MPNRLAQARSPYLLQHADQPVDWHEWGPEAFELARATDRPIFLSAGYSTCHWCHVMARESFDDPSIASLLNTLFVNVKLDREERPDVDRLYMTFVQATTGHGGWPMSVWLTPDLKPFYGGTYFHPRGGHGRPGFVEVIRALATAWANDRERLTANATEIVGALAEASVGASARSPAIGEPRPEEIAAAAERFLQLFDQEHAGFGGAPKFPRPALLLGLSRILARLEPGTERHTNVADMIARTLRALRDGGIRDHIGGGFHRYTVDERWHVPHFEKMLYDQGQIARALADGMRQLGLRDLAPALAELADYVQRDLTHPLGGGYAAEDADSAPPEAEQQHGHGVEGAFYTWAADELHSTLGDETYPLFEYAYGIRPEGNIPERHDPHGELSGMNIPERVRSDEETSAHSGLGAAEVGRRLAQARETLRARRTSRPRPHLDDKVLTAWNGLMMSGLAHASRALASPELAARATRMAEFVRTHLADPNTGALLRSWREGPSPVAGFAEDHAALVQGLLDLYETTFDWRQLAWALELQEVLLRDFEDREHGGFFNTRSGASDLILRLKEDYDGAEPSASSLSALNLARLSAMLDRRDLREAAQRTVKATAHRWRVEPFSMPAMLAAADFLAGPVRQVVVSGKPEDPRTQALLRTVEEVFDTRRVVVLDDRGEGRAWLAAQNPILGAGSLETPPWAHVCDERGCSAPVQTPEDLRPLLEPAKST